MSVSTELLCSFELLKPLDSNALKHHIKKGRNKRNQMLNSPVCLGNLYATPCRSLLTNVTARRVVPSKRLNRWRCCGIMLLNPPRRNIVVKESRRHKTNQTRHRPSRRLCLGTMVLHGSTRANRRVRKQEPTEPCSLLAPGNEQFIQQRPKRQRRFEKADTTIGTRRQFPLIMQARDGQRREPDSTPLTPQTNLCFQSVHHGHSCLQLLPRRIQCIYSEEGHG
jgi:hypothetical protein